MLKKDFYKRTWLNPKGQSSMSISVDGGGAQFKIRDCNDTVTIHSNYMDSMMGRRGYTNERNAFLRKLRLIKTMIETLEAETLSRWP